MYAIADNSAAGWPGDADAAIRQLYATHAPALRRYVERFSPDRTGADDIVQETFIRAWRHLPQLSQDDRPIRPWLFRVARNLLTDASRAAKAPWDGCRSSSGETSTSPSYTTTPMPPRHRSGPNTATWP